MYADHQHHIAPITQGAPIGHGVDHNVHPWAKVRRLLGRQSHKGPLIKGVPNDERMKPYNHEP